jgi:predicted AlkP superfamily pyrophosphatase or phosphodiesterase
MRTDHVIIVGIDGLRPDQVNEQTMPNLAAMKARGVSSANHRTVFPSETRGALTALANGARPAQTGILGNVFYARGDDPALARTDTLHDWHANDDTLPGGYVSATSLGETLAKAGMTLAVVTSSGQGSFTALSWKGDQWGNVGFNVRHPQIAYPHDIAASIEGTHKVPSGGFDRGAETKAVEIFIQSVWPAVLPEASIIWLTEVDSASHKFGLGSEGQLETMKSCDAAIGALLEWRDSQPNAQDILIMVTSDHGHVTSAESVDVAKTLREAGIKVDSNFAGDADILMRRGRTPGLWLRKVDPGLLTSATQILAAQPWYGACFTRPLATDPMQPSVEGTLSMALTGADHRRAPDLYLEMAGNNGANEHGVGGTAYLDAGAYTTLQGGGTHGGMHWSELSAVLIADGALVKKGSVLSTRTGIYDLAPTILHLLGVKPPVTMSGRALLDLFEGEPVAPVESQMFEASLNGKTSKLTVSTVADRMYLDHAGDGPSASA